MEHYYVPSQFTLTSDSLFSVLWMDDNYLVFNGCPDRVDPIALDYVKVSPWGFTTDIGTSSIGIDTKLLVGEGCDTSEYNIATVSSSRTLLDAPNFSPYEPIYFLGFLCFSIWFILFAFKFLLGKGYR